MRNRVVVLSIHELHHFTNCGPIQFLFSVSKHLQYLRYRQVILGFASLTLHLQAHLTFCVCCACIYDASVRAHQRALWVLYNSVVVKSTDWRGKLSKFKFWSTTS